MHSPTAVATARTAASAAFATSDGAVADSAPALMRANREVGEGIGAIFAQVRLGFRVPRG
ncbi:MAG: hypothetical protein NVSMB48_18770 [Marmoricola sp.]